MSIGLETDSDEEYDESSDEDYVPPAPQRGRGRGHGGAGASRRVYVCVVDNFLDLQIFTPIIWLHTVGPSLFVSPIV